MLFKLELATTEAKLTAHAGHGLFGEFCAAMSYRIRSIVACRIRAAPEGSCRVFMSNQLF